MKPSKSAIAALLDGRHADPFSLLGPHAGPAGTWVRALLPGAARGAAFTIDGEPLGDAQADRRAPGCSRASCRARPAGASTAAAPTAHDWWVTDPYSFGPVLGPMDDLLIARGHPLAACSTRWARIASSTRARAACISPSGRRNAPAVSLVGDFNGWDRRRHLMRQRQDIGVWEVFIPDIGPGLAYKYRITGADGTVLPLKADPFAFASELRPKTASIVADPVKPDWGDEAHRRHWAGIDPRREPISIYEVHPGSWRRDADGWFLSWDEMADQLIPYVADMGFTHIEFMPVSEHPYDPSWGYQTTGLYAPSARFGEPQGFARFVDGAHRAGIGVLIDWVPAHFPTDEHGLARFDGTALYEHADPRLGFHPDWDTAIYNFGRREVARLPGQQRAVLGRALSCRWSARRCRRLDALPRLFAQGRRVGSQPGGRARELGSGRLPAGDEPGALRHPPRGRSPSPRNRPPGPASPCPHDEDGTRTSLGFGFKWNMGFMHDTLRYMARDPVHRKHHHDDITFGLMYAFAENFVLPLSHDEVVHGKGSLLAKMSGDDWRQVRQPARLLRA